MIHAVTLLLIMYLFGGYSKLIPLACLAGILVVVSYNMSEHKSFRAILNGPRDDRFILLLTFILTVIVDLTVAIQLGMLLSAFLFMNKMAKISNVKSQTDEYVRTQDLSPQDDPNAITKFTLPPNVDVFELEGPLFFAAVFKFKEELAVVDRDVKILILRMRFVPYIDESGVNAIRELYNYLSKHGIKLILSGVQDNVYDELKASGLVAIINIKNIKRVIDAAVARAWEITNEEVK
jgi:SulP family sulfate permease